MWFVPEWLSPSEALDYAIDFELESLPAFGPSWEQENTDKLVSTLIASVCEGRVKIRHKWMELSNDELAFYVGTPTERRRQWRKWPDGIPEDIEFSAKDIRRVFGGVSNDPTNDDS